jgi:hypothetical protein
LNRDRDSIWRTNQADRVGNDLVRLYLQNLNLVTSQPRILQNAVEKRIHPLRAFPQIAQPFSHAVTQFPTMILDNPRYDEIYVAQWRTQIMRGNICELLKLLILNQ